MRILVHGGANQIGKSCIEIASATTRIILDCGWPLEDEADLTPPPVSGLFAPGEPPDAILLSHAHPDHTGFIQQIAAKVPIYATADTSKIMKVGSIYVPDAVQLPQDCFQEVFVPCSWRERVHPFNVGDLRITAYPVDHSSPGAVGYLVENAGQRIFYTGDLRFHGRKPGMHKRILKDLSGKLDLLITEGTNVGRKQSGLKSEEEVEDRAVTLSRECQSLVLVAYSPQNIDRFVSYYRAAVRAERTFVCDHYQAAVLYQLHKTTLPKPSRDELRVYLPIKRKTVKAYEDRFGDSIITLDEILAAPERFMMLVRPSMILNDLSGRLPPETILLYGMWSGYRTKPEWQETEVMIASSGGEVIECHASGHAHGGDLFGFIDELRPERIRPVHTESTIAFHQRFGAKCVNSLSV
jgi:ribonuclease J